LKYGIVIDLKKCIGCMACTVACKVDNNTRPGVYWNKVKDMEFGKYPEVTRIFLPVQCMQCENAPCIEVCPTGAITRDETTGIVRVSAEKCNGCRLCEEACPLGVIVFSELEGKAVKCELCDGEPQCVDFCPTGALAFKEPEDAAYDRRKAVAGRLKDVYLSAGSLGK